MKNTENMKKEELEDSLAVINSFLDKYDLSDMTLFTIFKSDIPDSNHGLYSILSEYEGVIWRKDKIIKVRKEDADTLLKLQEKPKHILLDCYIEYLISCFSEYHKKSRFLNCLDEYLLRSKSLFIERNDNVISTTVTLLVWLVLKFPNEKNRYHDRFLDIMMKECSKEILAEIVLSFTEDKILSRFFTEDEYKLLFDKVYVDHVDSERKYYFYKTLYQSFLENPILKKWERKSKNALLILS